MIDQWDIMVFLFIHTYDDLLVRFIDYTGISTFSLGSIGLLLYMVFEIQYNT